MDPNYTNQEWLAAVLECSRTGLAGYPYTFFRRVELNFLPAYNNTEFWFHAPKAPPDDVKYGWEHSCELFQKRASISQKDQFFANQQALMSQLDEKILSSKDLSDLRKLEEEFGIVAKGFKSQFPKSLMRYIAARPDVFEANDNMLMITRALGAAQEIVQTHDSIRSNQEIGPFLAKYFYDKLHLDMTPGRALSIAMASSSEPEWNELLQTLADRRLGKPKLIEARPVRAMDIKPVFDAQVEIARETSPPSHSSETGSKVGFGKRHPKTWNPQ